MEEVLFAQDADDLVDDNKPDDDKVDKVVEDKVVEDKVVEDKVVEDKVVEDKVVEPTAVELRLGMLEKENKRLGYSLRKARDEHKNKDNEEDLTEEQIKAIYEEHSNDPAVMYDVMKYQAKRATEDQADVQETTLLRKTSSNKVTEMWPDMREEGSVLHQAYTTATKGLKLEGHPMQEFLTLGAMVVDDLPQIKQMAYDQGKADALKDTTDNKRKKNIKTDILSPPGKPAVKETEELSADQVAATKQMDLSPTQLKKYKELVLGDRK